MGILSRPTKPIGFQAVFKNLNWQIKASSKKVTLSSGYCWRYTELALAQDLELI